MISLIIPSHLDPNTVNVIIGLLTNGLYSVLLHTSNKAGEPIFRRESISEKLIQRKAIFASILEEELKDFTPSISHKEFCEFLNLHQTQDIIERIYSFDGFSFEDYYNRTSGGCPNSLESVSESSFKHETILNDFTSILSTYFSDKKGISDIAPHIFYTLIRCCQKSLEIIIEDEQDLSAVNSNLTFYFKHCFSMLSRIIILIGIPRPPATKYNFINMAPKTLFIRRDVEYERLVNELLNSKSNGSVAITTSLFGAGGYGKTTLAKAVCHDQLIIDKFSDGILWVTLGENPKNLIGHIQDLIYRLSDNRPEFEGLDAATSYFRDLLQGKRLLLVIDDVWDSAHLEPFIEGGTDCVRLITTRVNKVLPEGTEKVIVGKMTDDEAIKLLLSGIQNDLPYSSFYKINSLVERLGYWPLLLKIVNGALKEYINRSRGLEESLHLVNRELDRKNLTAFSPKDPKKRDQAVEATLSVSFCLLYENELKYYKELAIFPEDEEIHLDTVEKLWSESAKNDKCDSYDSFEVDNLCYKFFNLSLLETFDGDKKIIKLHDVMRKYLMQQLELDRVHSLFLDAYKVKEWMDLPKEEIYLWRNLSYHLFEAKRIEELKELLFNFKWMRCKLEVTDVHLLMEDYCIFHDEYAIDIVKEAIHLSANAVYKDKKLLGGQLLGRLKSYSETEDKIKLLLKSIWEQEHKIRVLPLTVSLTPPGGSLLCTLEGHFDPVVAVTVTPDGKRAVSASSDTVRVWDLNSGKEIYKFKRRFYRFNTISATNSYVVSASEDKMLKIWSLKTGEEVRTLEGHSEPINSIHVFKDKYIVSASSDKTLILWDIKTGKKINTLIEHSESVNSVCVISEGKYLISASSDKTLKVWDLKTGTPKWTLTGHLNEVTKVCVTPDGDYAVSASTDSTLIVWDLKTGTLKWTLTDHSGFISGICVTSNGDYAVSASTDNTLKVWDLKTGTLKWTLTGHYATIRAVCVTPDGNYAVSASNDKTLKVWNLNAGSEVHTLEGHSEGVRAVCVTPDGSYAVSASYDKTLKVWNLKTGQEACTANDYSCGSTEILADTSNNHSVLLSDKTLKMRDNSAVEIDNSIGHFDAITAICITSDRKYAVSASYDKTLKVWDLNKVTVKWTLTGHSGFVTAVCITSNGKYIVSASTDNSLRVWDLRNGTEKWILEGHLDVITAVSVTPDGNYAISASYDNTLKVWNLNTGKIDRTLEGHLDWVWAVSVTPNGDYAVSASSDKTLKVWRLKTGEEVRTLEGHSGSVWAVNVTPDGDYAVSASSDKTLKIWRLKTGEEVCTLEGHSDVVTAISIIAENYVISRSSDDTLKVWRLKTGEEVCTLRGHSDTITEFSVSSDGKFAVSCSWDSVLKVWDLNSESEISSFRGESPFLSVVFSPDNSIIVAGEQNARVHFLHFGQES